MKRTFTTLLIIVLTSLFLTGHALQQHTFALPDEDSVRTSTTAIHHEVPDDKYLPVSRDELPRSPAYRADGSSYFTTQVNITDEGENIVGDAANEPSIAIVPDNPDKMVIGWRQFNTISSNFRQAGYAYTLDGGDNWTFPGVIEPGIFRSDPVLSADADGNIYYNSLSSSGGNFFCHVFPMEEGAEDWGDGVYALGGDKQWMIVDRSGGMGEGHHYAFWTRSYSTCYPDHFTRSVDAGESYESCVSVAGSPQWGTLATGPDGTLYVAGYSDFGFIVARSSTAQNNNWPVSWDAYSEVDLDGFPGFGGGPNPGGLLGQTWIATDVSDGPHSGNIYVLSSVERISNNDPLDVMFARSTDGGITWEDPVRVNQDISTQNWQWFGTMSVAPDGRIDVVWLDTRDVPAGYYSALYYAYSIDGGQTFSEDEKISESFDPHLGWPQQDKMGDYFHMISDYDYAHLAWANTLNGEQDVYYTRINPWFVGMDETIARSIAVSLYPNPSTDQVTATFRNDRPGRLQIGLFDVLGNIVYRDSRFVPEATPHSETLPVADLPEGVYYLKLGINGQSVTRKLVLAR